tara:strand:+ start:57 stop:551 length:495 start_codon:yes stop_codon:yes gene_type:complete
MAYDQINQAGRGPKQKTGAGIPSVLLQETVVTDEKSGKNLGAYNSSMSDPVPTKTGDASTDSYVSNLHTQDVKDDEARNKRHEDAYQEVKAVRGGTFNIGGKRNEKTIVNIESVDDKGGFNYQNPSNGNRGYVSREAAKESAATGYSVANIQNAIKRRLSKKNS